MANQLRDIAATLRGLVDPGDWIGMKPQLDPSSSVLSLDHKPDPFEIKLRIGVGLFVVTVVAIIVTFLDDGLAIFVACGFGFFGLLNLILGVVKSRFEKSMLFTGREVIVKTQGLFGREDWREPIDAYRGVLMREQHLGEQGVGTINSTKTYHVVELAHRSIARTLPLYVREGGDPPRDIQEAFARRFDLPALAPDSDGVAERAADALDLPIAGQPAADPGPPPSGVTLRSEDGATRITVGQGRLGAVITLVFWIAIPLVFGGIGFMIEPIAGLMAGGMAVFFVLLMLGLGAMMGGNSKDRRPALVVEAEQVWIDRPKQDDRLGRLVRRILSAVSGHALGAGKPPPETMPRNSVEQIRVDTYTSHRSASSSDTGHAGATVHARLVIEGDGGRLAFVGSQFDRRKLEWVRDYLRHEMAGDTRQAFAHDQQERSVSVG